MTNGIPEADWKKFRNLHKVALDRFCHRTLSDVRAVIDKPGADMHERYLAVFELIRNRDKELATAFDDMRRSIALQQLVAQRRLGLITDDEFAQFSPQTQQTVSAWLA
jgi:hypothetical protein